MFTYMIYILETAEMVFLICTGVDENVVDDNDSSNCKDMNNSFEDKYNEDSDGFNDGDSFNEDKYNGSFDDYYGVDENKEDTDDNDEDIDDIVDEISLEEVNKPSYYPFKSKEELMLYVLINSPIPIVSHCCVYIVIHLICALQAEKVLDYFFHFMKEVNPFLPSLAQVKSIDLPGYNPPSKVSAEG